MFVYPAIFHRPANIEIFWLGLECKMLFYRLVMWLYLCCIAVQFLCATFLQLLKYFTFSKKIYEKDINILKTYIFASKVIFEYGVQ